MKRQHKKPANYRSILGIQNAKTSKGEKLGYLTGILYLSPANESGVMNTCVGATAACIAGCLKSAGRMAMSNAVKSRIAKTVLFHSNPELFYACLRHDIETVVLRAKKKGMTPAIRINGTSDLPKIAMAMSAEFPDVQFYDYTKLPKPELRARANYHVTFSYSGENLPQALGALQNGVNVSVVFSTPRGAALPSVWNGRPVIDGDSHDLRFLDPTGVVVGLRAKGDARKQVSPFIVLT
jgi:hypothetical protein